MSLTVWNPVRADKLSNIPCGDFLMLVFTLNLKLIAVEQSLRHSSERVVDREDGQAILQLLCLD